MTSVTEMVEEYQEKIYALFNELHAHPELGFKESLTSSILKTHMINAGCFDEIVPVGETGLIGVIQGSEPGPVVGIRADMDALPFDIDGEQVSRHACGHDAHMTMALTASVLAGRAGLRRGTLKLILQPAEEVFSGAVAMVESGQVNDIDELYGAHLRPIQEARLGQAAAGLWHSASRMVKVKVTGRGAHGARPHLGINAIDAGVAIVGAVNAIHQNPASNFSVKCTSLLAGGLAANIVPASCELGFDARAEHNSEMDELLAKMAVAVEHGAASVGAKGELIDLGGAPAAEYDQELLGVTRRAITTVLGDCLPDIHTPGGEDFHYFATKGGLRTAYFALGADLTPGLHAVDMHFNHDALALGVKIWLHIIDERLNMNKD